MELNKPKWEKEAERLSELQEGTYTSQHKITYTHGFVDGAQTYADSVEKMLKEKHDRESQIRKSTESSKIWDKANDKINIIEELLFELKSIQP